MSDTKNEIQIKIVGNEDVVLLSIKPSEIVIGKPKESTLEVKVNMEVVAQVTIPAIIGHEDVQFIRIKLAVEKPVKK